MTSNESLPNGLFGWSLNGFSGVGTTSLTGAAVGTPFEGGLATLPGLSATEGPTLASLPGSGVSFYDDGTYSSVFGATYGSGRYAFTGYDWFDGFDADWAAVTDSAVEYLTGGESEPVPEPMTMLLFGTGLVGLIGAKRKKMKE